VVLRNFIMAFLLRAIPLPLLDSLHTVYVYLYVAAGAGLVSAGASAVANVVPLSAAVS